MTDTLKHQLGQLVDEPTHDEVDAALRSILARHRRQRRALAVAGVAAATTTVIGAVALFDRSDPAPDNVAVADDGVPDWPWATSTTVPGRTYTEEELEPTRQEVIQRARQYPEEADRWIGYGGVGLASDGRLVVTIMLRADAHELAAELWPRWGDKVEITVGGRIYPTGEIEGPTGGCCSSEAAPDEGIPGLEGTLEFADDEVPAGGETTATLVLHNTTDADLTVVNPSLAYIVEAGTRRRVGVPEGPFTLGRFTAIVPAHGTASIGNIVVGTTSAAPGTPPALGPGPYEAVVEVSLDTIGPDPSPAIEVRAPFTVVD
jgi:hypothetical protein